MAAPSRKKSTPPTKVEAISHDDSRKNIPTAELGDFAAAHEKNPPTMRYPRDPSLDPQLVWQGKDEQDGEDLSVLTVPVYIQEKIEPKAIIEDLRRDSADRGDELRLFSDFNGIEPEHVLDFYNHGVNWSNRMILGDSLLVMNSLAEKENLKGQVQMIYIDPPYGIKFGSNWQVSTRKRDVRDGKDTDLVRQPEQIRAFRDTWERGIHSYLSYLRDRLVVARELLTESGSVFVQIGDENVHVVRSLLDEVFGSESFVGLITFKKTSGAGSFGGGTLVLPSVNDYLVWYAKDRDQVKYRQPYAEKQFDGAGGGQYRWVEAFDGSRRRLKAGEAPVPEERVFSIDNLTSQSSGGPQFFDVEFEDRNFPAGRNGWKTTKAGMASLIDARRLHSVGNTLCYVRYIDDFPVFPLNNLWEDTMVSGFADPKVYVVQTNTKVIARCLLMTTDPGDLVLDPTCGSGTTAYVAEQWGRRWITIDTSRVSLALARTRLMASRFPYYLLTDSPEGREQEAKLAGIPPATSPTNNDIKQGFVYKRVPHITLKSIANNPDIKEGMTREEIDAAIARHADQELLVDRPYEDNKRVRVTGRFTFESLSPHRVLDPEEQDQPESEVEADRGNERIGYVPNTLDNLRKAGVQNRIKHERLSFDTLEPHPGEWIQATGTYTDGDGLSRRVAVSIGPEHGTVGPLQIKNAAIEAVRGLGHDVLIVCGFAFDAQADETAKQFGELVVLPTRMNSDLLMGDELLKKTGAGNLFMVFGEPDVNIKEEDGELVVELRGLDVYDPTTGEIRSDSTDDIACWFIDTNYNRESFFVRHAYFTGAGDPYDRLKRALRAEIDEDAWSTLYSTVSRPFPTPETGRIAIKVINHYGDEVLKVYEVS
jgi:adenine-specific DNA-methyltransferase